jgi:mannosyltransferase OCH1-like enzyme
MIPNNIFFIFGLKKQTEELLFFYYLSVVSAKVVNQPDNIYFYYHYEPFGKWWNKIKKIVKTIKVDIPTHWGKEKINHYAHAADFLRMKLLYDQGGIYMDIDTISIHPYISYLNNKCVMAKQLKPIGLCNAIMMCEPKSDFLKVWLDNYKKYFKSTPPGTIYWDLASIKLPYRLSVKHKDLITILEPETFFVPNWDKCDMIFEKENNINPKLITLHLWESASMKYLQNIKNYSWFKENSHTLYGKIGLELMKKYDIENYSSNINNKLSNKCIPKIIHQTWKTKEIPEKMKFCVNSWKILNPNYQYMFWTDEDIDKFIYDKYPQFKNIYSKLSLGIQKADLIRILILHYYGGIYADIDFECLKPINIWDINHSKVNVAFEPKDHHSTDTLCNALILSPKNMSVLLEIIEHGKHIINKNNREVMNLFGPIAWTKVLKTHKCINLINRKLIYPVPDITIKKSLEIKYDFILKNKDFGNAYCIHYWEHSNWPRTNILNKYYKFISPKIKITSINICGLYRNNSSYLEKYFIPKLIKLEEIYPFIEFYYYFYENDSTDNTKYILSEFAVNRECQVLTEINDSKLFKRNTNKKRIINISNCRNKLLSLRPFKGEWSLMIDSDIEFPDNLISRFICKILPDDLIALSCNGKDHIKCLKHKDCYHYYDILALIDSYDVSGYNYNVKHNSQCCQLSPFNDRKNWFNNNLVKVKSAFGGLTFYKTNIINNENIKYYVNNGIKFIKTRKNIFCEHHGFCNKLNEKGSIYIDPSMTVFLNNKYEKNKHSKYNKKNVYHPDVNLPIDLSKVKIEADVWVCSYGGCASNYLVKKLEKYGYKTQTDLYHKILSHSPVQIKTDKPIIYLYRNIQDAWNSVKSRGIGWYDVNIKKLSNNKNVIISDENLLKLMIEQFKNWTKNIGNNILYLSYKDMFSEKGNILLKKFLNNKNIEKFDQIPSTKKYKFPDYLEEKYKLSFNYFYNFREKIKYYRIYGERNSGTNFIEKLISENFYLQNFTYKKHGLPVSDCSEDTLTVCIIREYSNWLNSMIINPYHLKQEKKYNLFFNDKMISGQNPPNPYYDINLGDNYSLLELRYIKYNAYKKLNHNTIIVKLDYLQESTDNIISFLKFISEKYNLDIKKLHLINEYIGGQGDKYTKNKKVTKNYKKINTSQLKFYNEKIESEINNITY